MKFLIITKKLNEKTKKDLLKLESAIKKKKSSFEVIEFSDVETFYEKIHEKGYKNTYDVLITFGGDGTILKGARVARKLDIPIFGINVGTIGFLTSTKGIKNINDSLDKILKKNVVYENRSMLNVEVIKDGKVDFKAYAVNEATITTKCLTKMGKYEVYIGSDDEMFNEYRADGLIVSNPTGSTGHSLSAGGPIVAPDVNCFIITAICPHAFNQRSIVINGDETIYINVNSNNQIVDIDGRTSCDVSVNDIIKITKLKHTLRFIAFEKNQFIKNIKSKIRNI